MADGEGTKGWPIVNGRATIPFYVNPTPPRGSVFTAEDVERGYLLAVATWAAASPTVRFEYLGTTTREPIAGDGVSVFAFGGFTSTRKDANGFINEADILRAAPVQQSGGGWKSAPCEQRDNACTDIGGNYFVLEALLTHEVGHTLALGDLGDDDIERNQTMYNDSERGERRRVTLALGDVLGVRKLYPCSCPPPVIYAP